MNMKSPMKIAIGGSAADPSHLGHHAVLETLIGLERFDLVVWILSGFRPGKQPLVTPDDRVAMTELMLPNIWRLKTGTNLIVRYNDVYGDNTPTVVWLERIRREYPAAEIVWFTGSDSVVPQTRFRGRCEIEARWKRGRELMVEGRFLVLCRQGYPKPSGLGGNFEVLDVDLPNVSSSEIRRLIADGQSFEHLVDENVAAYIKRGGLYGYQTRKGN
jgi:nicotinate-nucleotide adenylyltransferase